MADPKNFGGAMDDMAHESQQKKARKPKAPRGDHDTLDIFSGEPIGQPPAPRKLSKKAAALLEWILALNRPVTLGRSTEGLPGAISPGTVPNLVQELVRAKYLRAWIPPGADALPGKESLQHIATQEARLWLSKLREEQERQGTPKTKRAPDDATGDLLQGPRIASAARSPTTPTQEATPEEMKPENQSWAIGRVRILARRNLELDLPGDIWHDLRRPSRGAWEDKLFEWAIGLAGSRGWIRKLPGSQGAYRSLIYED